MRHRSTDGEFAECNHTICPSNESVVQTYLTLRYQPAVLTPSAWLSAMMIPVLTKLCMNMTSKPLFTGVTTEGKWATGARLSGRGQNARGADQAGSGEPRQPPPMGLQAAERSMHRFDRSLPQACNPRLWWALADQQILIVAKPQKPVVIRLISCARCRQSHLVGLFQQCGQCWRLPFVGCYRRYKSRRGKR